MGFELDAVSAPSLESLETRGWGMQLSNSVPFDPQRATEAFFGAFPARPAVFALFGESNTSAPPAPYIGRTRNLRQRLVRLLRSAPAASRALSLRAFTRRIDYQWVGPGLEAAWLVYQLQRYYYPRQYRQRLRLKPPVLLRLNLRDRFPRCYPTRRLVSDGSLYYGPFPSRLAAEHFAAEFLGFFKIRRCIEELDPHPSHPGCVYSEMQMCLAPCFGGCTDEEYQQEVGRVAEFLDGAGQNLLRALECERGQASEALEFERADKAHRKLEKVQAVLRLRPDVVRNLRALDGLVVEPGADAQSVALFRIRAGELRGPVTLSLDENVPSPVPLDRQLRALLEALDAGARNPEALPPWEHLSLLARWYYSSFRVGELLMLNSAREIPYARLIRLCRKVLGA
jgi:excinuclease UvrABC nuclease subunit